MKKLTIALLSVVMLGALFSSCDNKQKKPPVDLKEKDQVELNGVSMDMIFVTGCSGMSISLNELLTMQKNGKFSESDVVGITEATIADGSVVEKGLINLREVEIGGKDGIKLHNVQASVALNQIAPIHLGNGDIDAVASVEVDNINKTIRFKRR